MKRIVVLGAGHLGRIHTRLLKTQQGVELAGVVDSVPAARAAAEQEFGVPTFARWQDVPSELDGAILATPTFLHHEIGCELLLRGVHLFVEKPITSTVAEADELISLAQRQDLVLQVGHVERFNPAFRAVLPFFSPPQPPPRLIVATRTSGFTFRSTDIGVVHDMMIHDLDLVLSLMRTDVSEVEAQGLCVMGGHEDLANARMTFSDGGIATLHASRVSPDLQRTMQIFSDTAHATLDFQAGVAKVIEPSSQLLEGEFDIDSLSPEERQQHKTTLFTGLLKQTELPLEKRNAIADEQAEFLTAITTGARPTVTGDDACRALLVAEQIVSCLDLPIGMILRGDFTKSGVSRRKVG